MAKQPELKLWAVIYVNDYDDYSAPESLVWLYRGEQAAYSKAVRVGLEDIAPLVADGSFVALSGEDGWSLRIEFYAGRARRVELVGSEQFPGFSRELRAGEFFVYHCVNPLQIVVPNAGYWRKNWTTNLYRLVAKVSAQDAEGTWQVTQHIDQDWRGNAAVELLTQTQVRSSAVGDVIVATGGECYMAMMQDWLRL